MRGLAGELENGGGVVAQMQDRWAEVDARRMERLDRLIKAGKGKRPQREEDLEMPAWSVREERIQMAERKPKPCCGSKGPRCFAGCDGSGTKKAQAETKKPRRETPRRSAETDYSELEQLTVEQLVALRAAVMNELAARRQSLETQLEEIAKATREAA